MAGKLTNSSVQLPQCKLATMLTEGLAAIEVKRSSNLFQELEGRGLTEQEEAIIAKQVALNRRLAEAGERQERTRKMGEIMDRCPDLTEEEAKCALKMCNDREEDAVLELTSGSGFLQRVRRQCAGGQGAAAAAAQQFVVLEAGAQKPARARQPAGRIRIAAAADGVFVGSFRGKGWEKLPRIGAAAAAAPAQDQNVSLNASVTVSDARAAGEAAHPPALKASQKGARSKRKRRVSTSPLRVIADLSGPVDETNNAAVQEIADATTQEVELEHEAARISRDDPSSSPAEEAGAAEVHGEPIAEVVIGMEGRAGEAWQEADEVAGSPTEDEASAPKQQLRRAKTNGSRGKQKAAGPSPPTRPRRQRQPRKRYAEMENFGDSEDEEDEEQPASPPTRPRRQRQPRKRYADVEEVGESEGEEGEAASPPAWPRRQAQPRKRYAVVEGLEDSREEEEEEEEAPSVSGASLTPSPSPCRRTSKRTVSKTLVSSPAAKNPRSPVKAVAAQADAGAAASPSTSKRQRIAPAPAASPPRSKHRHSSGGAGGAAAQSPAAAAAPAARMAVAVPAQKPRLGRVKRSASKQVELVEVGKLRLDKGWHNGGYIYPDGYVAKTVFRSSVALDQLCVHELRIIGAGGQFWPGPTFRITALDRPADHLDRQSATGCWNAALGRINAEIEEQRRAGADLPPPPKTAIAGPEYFGLTHPVVLAAIEALDPDHRFTSYWEGKASRLAYGQAHGVAPTPKVPGGAGSGAMGARPPAAQRTRRSGRRRGRRGSDDDDDVIFAADGSDGEGGGCEGEAEFTANRWSGVERSQRYQRRHGAAAVEVAEDNPLPELMDPITLEPVVNPAIAPSGHVMGLATWHAVLAEQGKCPFTQQPLRREQLQVLTKANIERFRPLMKL